MNYTKGEWKVNNTSFARYSTYRGKALGGRTFVVNKELETVADVEGNTQEEAEANAQLISACPDMYEALKRLIKLMPDCGGCIKTEVAILEAQEAIDKAEGKGEIHKTL